MQETVGQPHRGMRVLKKCAEECMQQLSHLSQFVKRFFGQIAIFFESVVLEIAQVHSGKMVGGSSAGGQKTSDDSRVPRTPGAPWFGGCSVPVVPGS